MIKQNLEELQLDIVDFSPEKRLIKLETNAKDIQRLLIQKNVSKN